MTTVALDTQATVTNYVFYSVMSVKTGIQAMPSCATLDPGFRRGDRDMGVIHA